MAYIIAILISVIVGLVWARGIVNTDPMAIGFYKEIDQYEESS